MNTPLLYLISMKLKNQLKSFLKSPVKLICFVLAAACIGLTIFSGQKMNTQDSIRDIRELTAIITAFYSVMFVVMSYKGFGNGASMFSMADVNMIFTAPFVQRKVLFYGLFQQLGTSVLLGIFVLFQYGWLHGVYGVGYGVVLLLLLGYALTIFLAQISAMVIYAFTSANDGRKRLVKIIYFAVIAAFAVCIALPALGNRADMIGEAAAAVNGPVVGLFPVSGWIGRAVAGILLGNATSVVVGLLLSAAFLAGMVSLMTYGKQDFYEDVLKSSEITQSAITARKEGRVGDTSPSRVKLGKTGIGKGFGASAFYYKHRLENRRSRAFILEPVSLIYAVIVIVMAFFTKGAGISAVFTTATIFQIFIVALGRFNKELTKPYIYLIPEPPLQKMLYALAESLPSTVLESLVVFIPVALIQGATPMDTALCIVARISFAFLFTAVNIAVERLWGGSSSKSTVMILYFAMMVVMAVPGIVLAAILGSLNPGAGQNAAVFLSLTVCNIPIGLLVMFLCRNMLQYAELNQR